MTTWLLRSDVGDFAALGGYLRMPARGPWYLSLDLHSDAAAPAEGSVAQLLVTAEALEGETAPAPIALSGTILRSRRWPGAASLAVSMVGGAGGLERELPALGHVFGSAPVPVGLLVRAIVDAAGEQLAAGVEATLDAFQVTRWHRTAGPAAAALGLLIGLVARAAGVELGWRVLGDGTIWVGVEAWPTVSAADRALSPDLDDGRTTYAPRGMELLPGQLVDGARAAEVLYTLSPPRLRAEVRREVSGAPPRPLALDLYARTYSATARAQDAATGLLDISCDDAKIGDLRAVPLRCGIPGARIVFAAPAGERVRLAFDGADPRLPFAAAMDQDLAAVRPVARRLDHVACGSITGTCAGVPVTFTYTPSPLDPMASPTVGEAADLLGVVSSGSAEVKIR